MLSEIFLKYFFCDYVKFDPFLECLGYSMLSKTIFSRVDSMALRLAQGQELTSGEVDWTRHSDVLSPN